MSAVASVSSQVADVQFEEQPRIFSDTADKSLVTCSESNLEYICGKNEPIATVSNGSEQANVSVLYPKYFSSQKCNTSTNNSKEHNCTKLTEAFNSNVSPEYSCKDDKFKNIENENIITSRTTDLPVSNSIITEAQSGQELLSKKRTTNDRSLFERFFMGSKKSLDKLRSSQRNERNTTNQNFSNIEKKPVSSDIISKIKESNYKSSEEKVEVKAKLFTVWNNMKYGWNFKRDVKLKSDSPIWLLGQYYHAKLHDIPASQSVVTKKTHSVQDIAKDHFKQDLMSRIWLTYRQNFPKIPGTDFITDSGWGCMLRAGQMMMAQALICHFLSRAWRLSSTQTEATKTFHRMIIRWFGDSLSSNSPFSIHNLVSLGTTYDRKIGDWYGPTHVAHVLRKALIQAKKGDHRLKNICMYVASDGIVFKQDVIDLCTNSHHPESSPYNSTLNCDLDDSSTSFSTSEKEQCRFKDSYKEQQHKMNNFDDVFAKEPVTRWKSDESLTINHVNFELDRIQKTRRFSECEEATEHFYYDPELPSYSDCVSSSNIEKTNWQSLVLFVSVRLGNDKINPFYIPCLKSLLTYEHCIGIIGGRPKHAVYFIGFQGEKLIHLDPHSCQPFVDVQKDDFSEKSFHCSFVRTLSFSDMDPSCAIGFYFRTREEFEYFSDKFAEIASPMKKNLDYPLFALTEGRRSEVEEISSRYTSQTILSSSYTFKSDMSKEDEEYILL